jgi:hypothetical protein
MAPFDERQKMQQVLGAVDKRIVAAKIRHVRIEKFSWGMLQTKAAIEAKCGGSAGEVRDSHLVAEDILVPPKVGRLRSNREI